MAANAKDDRETSRSAAPIERAAVPLDKLFWGVSALTAWILIFGAGLLIETVDYRHALAPRSVSLESPESNAGNGQGAKAQTSIAPFDRGPIYSFFAALICFTPLNLFFLALAAGLAGGCASNIAIETMPRKHRAAIAIEHPRRNLLLQEPPISAAFRGFIVYLIVIAGLYVVLDNPFKDPSAGQYIRLAGTLSIMALLVGYDATRIEDWLRVIPGPGISARTTEEHPVPETQAQAEAKEAKAAAK